MTRKFIARGNVSSTTVYNGMVVLNFATLEEGAADVVQYHIVVSVTIQSNGPEKCDIVVLAGGRRCTPRKTYYVNTPKRRTLPILTGERSIPAVSSACSLMTSTATNQHE